MFMVDRIKFVVFDKAKEVGKLKSQNAFGFQQNL